MESEVAALEMQDHGLQSIRVGSRETSQDQAFDRSLLQLLRRRPCSLGPSRTTGDIAKSGCEAEDGKEQSNPKRRCFEGSVPELFILYSSPMVSCNMKNDLSSADQSRMT